MAVSFETIENSVVLMEWYPHSRLKEIGKKIWLAHTFFGEMAKTKHPCHSKSCNFKVQL